LFENAAATATGLFAIILMFGPVSGGHFNPVVSLADASFGGITWRDALAYLPAQIAGCTLGALVANGMFSLAAVSISTHHRATPAYVFSEVIDLGARAGNLDLADDIDGHCSPLGRQCARELHPTAHPAAQRPLRRDALGCDEYPASHRAAGHVEQARVRLSECLLSPFWAYADHQLPGP